MPARGTLSYHRTRGCPASLLLFHQSSSPGNGPDQHPMDELQVVPEGGGSFAVFRHKAQASLGSGCTNSRQRNAVPGDTGETTSCT